SATGEGVSYVGAMLRSGGTLNIVQGTAVEHTTLNAEQPAQVYTVLGMPIGTFTLSEALQLLPKGIYIFKQHNTTDKITIK
ncbi:MAG: hypothetical protein IJQ97_05880, partial [Paludibacteraceae bacterium]|nr:hypothetical protein [Paludibacteraceae bacterium]